MALGKTERSHGPKLRPVWDRVRQVALFEVGGLAVVTPPFSWASGEPPGESLGLLALLALLAALWNAAYSTTLDWVEGRVTGRAADQRTAGLRIAQAVGLEGGLTVITVPVIVFWTGMGWKAALAADISLTAAYCAYAFCFGLLYDRVFPIEPERARQRVRYAACAATIGPSPGARGR